MNPEIRPPRRRGLAASIASFRYAFRGIATLLVGEVNARIHAVCTAAVLVAGAVCHLSRMQWVAVVAAIALVWIAEAANTAVELLCDLFCEGRYHPMVKRIKDIAAGGVLIAAVCAIAIGLLVFL